MISERALYLDGQPVCKKNGGALLRPAIDAEAPSPARRRPSGLRGGTDRIRESAPTRDGIFIALVTGLGLEEQNFPFPG